MEIKKTNRNLKQVLLFTLLYIVMVGCTGYSSQMAKLQSIDSLMEQNPQAAYDSLCLYKKQMEEDCPRKVEMRYRLLAAKAQNKLYLQMPSDSVFQEVVDYYDSKGSTNEQMEAHYLMGCVYRDQKEAPKAMMCYKQAIECADTLSKECDYIILSKVYGQIAEIYSMQYLRRKAIENYQKYSDYSFLSNNKKDGIQGLLFVASEYYLIGDTLKALDLQSHCRKLYLREGMRKEAALSYLRLIYTLLNRAEYTKAALYMMQFESQSGLFDQNHNISKGHEHYYKAKGLYYLGINRLDSSEYFFRKLGAYNMKYESNNGLLSIFSKTSQTDSIKKYAKLSEQEMDNILNNTQADAVLQATSLYDYERLQKQVSDLQIQKEKNKNFLLFMCVVIVVLGICVYNRYKNNLRKKEESLTKLNSEYLQVVTNAQKTMEDYRELKKDSTLFEQKMAQKIKGMEEVIDEYETKFENIKQSDRIVAIESSDVYKKFKDATIPKLGNKVPCLADWNALEILFRQYFPLVYAKTTNVKLSAQEFRVCMLSRLKFDNREMCILLQTTTSSVCNAKLKVNSKLFSQSSASSLYKNLSTLM